MSQESLFVCFFVCLFVWYIIIKKAPYSVVVSHRVNSVLKLYSVDLTAVFNITLMGWWAGVTLQCIYENPMSNNFCEKFVIIKISLILQRLYT